MIKWLTDYYTVRSHSNLNLGKKFVEIKYIFCFNLPTKHKNVYDKNIRFILVLYSVHTVCQFLYCMVISSIETGDSGTA